uniref:Uncharacterized protein n=1 Tax=viral metagenome TaxID=1070528 RepID=A0A6M3IQZ5_9ZZZZ
MSDPYGRHTSRCECCDGTGIAENKDCLCCSGRGWTVEDLDECKCKGGENEKV